MNSLLKIFNQQKNFHLKSSTKNKNMIDFNSDVRTFLFPNCFIHVYVITCICKHILMLTRAHKKNKAI